MLEKLTDTIEIFFRIIFALVKVIFNLVVTFPKTTLFIVAMIMLQNFISHMI
ncbi:hypothetical protein H9L19_04805 [Weissella diestrammenae]|uniref:Uncharacterized protein n=1 Tax=Weissella diestrammenae TaxID=1162633 RepID=A0A7G9T3R8_9LACO|nr:hypothetical protein [Weissella diestrammenae]MCM0582725.1 hypothetical protein [Weissella diestrammenae]QNN74743.1 hypothetical protein H9L19_04805 [Weissella diestrammenae]